MQQDSRKKKSPSTSTRKTLIRECEVLLPYLPSHSEMKPTQKEESIPPMEKMATDRDQREVRVPVGMASPYRCSHVAL